MAAAGWTSDRLASVRWELARDVKGWPDLAFRGDMLYADWMFESSPGGWIALAHDQNVHSEDEMISAQDVAVGLYARYGDGVWPGLSSWLRGGRDRKAHPEFYVPAVGFGYAFRSPGSFWKRLAVFSIIGDNQHLSADDAAGEASAALRSGRLPDGCVLPPPQVLKAVPWGNRTEIS